MVVVANASFGAFLMLVHNAFPAVDFDCSMWYSIFMNVAWDRRVVLEKGVRVFDVWLND